MRKEHAAVGPAREGGEVGEHRRAPVGVTRDGVVLDAVPEGDAADAVDERHVVAVEHQVVDVRARAQPRLLALGLRLRLALGCGLGLGLGLGLGFGLRFGLGLGLGLGFGLARSRTSPPRRAGKRKRPLAAHSTGCHGVSSRREVPGSVTSSAWPAAHGVSTTQRTAARPPSAVRTRSPPG